MTDLFTQFDTRLDQAIDEVALCTISSLASFTPSLHALTGCDHVFEFLNLRLVACARCAGSHGPHGGMLAATSHE